ncbi:acyl carrier protein [Streptomyces poriferorum]|uniref:Acyl carrier protein n=1 Tax=Streptomyces poriferorum TaxID=2798799 RepID=A0ABY9ISH9_9ACTN|nr:MULTISPECIES: acyl carrier protein [Streptomyces]MDP5312602.1 acyl carrier protein [Streptomyces sp. Alt4]WLQ48954.1 acyl carrier protein [Streptomyces sp. Alt1]WLQ58370.1 acyl carrier protein [Streptomyces sp. Alt2]WSI63768.1 acyl carrier protein [Streptomyces sp. NBC_01336]
MSTEVEKFIIEALSNMNYDVSEVTGDTPLGPAGLDLESLSVAEVAIQVEDTYGVKFEEDEMETVALLTVAGLVKEIVDRVSAAAPAK